MILNNYYDNIYIPYICNKELTNIKWKLDELKLKVQYFKGFNGSLFGGYDAFLNNQKLKKTKDQSVILLTKGQYGHITTFVDIFKDAIKNKYKKILILEPDVYLCVNLDETYKKYIDLDYKILYLGASQNQYYTEKTWDNVHLISNYYYNAYKTLGTFAIAFDHTVFQETINLLSQYKVPTDVALFELQDKYNDVFVCYPNMICCNVINSSTNGQRHNKIIQTERMDDCRWTLDYDTREKITIVPNNKLNIDLFKLNLHINSKLSNYSININCDHVIDKKNNIYTVTIMLNKRKNVNENIIVLLSNIFIDKYNVVV